MIKKQVKKHYAYMCIVDYILSASSKQKKKKNDKKKYH